MKYLSKISGCDNSVGGQICPGPTQKQQAEGRKTKKSLRKVTDQLNGERIKLTHTSPRDGERCAVALIKLREALQCR